VIDKNDVFELDPQCADVEEIHTNPQGNPIPRTRPIKSIN
jgi:hypothetical protein